MLGFLSTIVGPLQYKTPQDSYYCELVLYPSETQPVNLYPL